MHHTTTNDMHGSSLQPPARISVLVFANLNLLSCQPLISFIFLSCISSSVLVLASKRRVPGHTHTHKCADLSIYLPLLGRPYRIAFFALATLDRLYSCRSRIILSAFSSASLQAELSTSSCPRHAFSCSTTAAASSPDSIRCLFTCNRQMDHACLSCFIVLLGRDGRVLVLVFVRVRVR